MSTTELAIHLWAGYQSEMNDDMANIDTVADIARFVPTLVKAYAATPTDGSYTGVFNYDVAQAAGAWLATQAAPTIEDFEAHVDALVRKGIVK